MKLRFALAVGFVLSAIPAFANYIQLLNEDGLPVAGASIRVGSGDFMIAETQSGLNGEITIPENWLDPAPVNIFADGYVPTTFTGILPVMQSLTLHYNDPRSRTTISGQTLGIDNIRRDGKIDFTIVFPALKRHELLHFDVSSVISVENDQIQIANESVNLPSNMTLPEQTESYLVPITFNKPLYRMQVGRMGGVRMVALQGQFPLRQVINDFRNDKSFYEMINAFRFTSGGSKDIQVADQSLEGQDVTVGQMAFEEPMDVRAPAEFPAESEMISFALSRQDDHFFPTDLKRVRPGETKTLAAPAGTPKFIASLLIKNPEAPENPYMNAVSVVFSGHDETPQFLNHIPKPRIQDGVLQAEVPAEIEGVHALATYVVLAEIETTSEGSYADKRYRLWHILSRGWQSEITLPADLGELDPAKKYRWEILFLGRYMSQDNDNESDIFESATHITRNFIDL